MPQLKLAEIFDYKNVTPSGLQKGNLIYFKYNSPNGVHDKSPLVYVLDKTFDKIYGVNIHYSMGELQDLVETIDFKVNNSLQRLWLTKHPEKKKDLKNVEFDKSMMEQKDYIEMVRRVDKKILEVFDLPMIPDDAFRSYLYKRMNNVSKLVYKT